MQRVLAALEGAKSVSDVEISAGGVASLQELASRRQRGCDHALLPSVFACLTARCPAAPTRPRPADGQWRPADTACEWLDITADSDSVAAALAAARPASAAGGASLAPGVKLEPGAEPSSGRGSGGSGAAAAAAVEELVVDDSESEEDEAEELRRAAAAVRRASSAALESLAGQVGCLPCWQAGVHTDAAAATCMEGRPSVLFACAHHKRLTGASRVPGFAAHGLICVCAGWLPPSLRRRSASSRSRK